MNFNKFINNDLDALTGIGSHAKLIKQLGMSSSIQKDLAALTGIGSHAKLIKRLGMSSAIQKDLQALTGIGAHAKLVRELTATLVSDYEDPIKGMSESFKAINSLQSQALEFKSFENKLVVNTNNTVTLNTMTLNYDEINEIANGITERTLAHQSQQFEKIITLFITEIQALKNPSVKSVMFQIFYPIIIVLITCILTPVADYYIKQSLTTEDRVIKKSIINNVVKKTKNIELLEPYRLVSTKVLNVRFTPKSKSLLIGKLYLGYVVLLVEKQKDWSLVVWTDSESGLGIQGWVYSRHLKKFK